MNFKEKEYFSEKGRDSFNDLEEANLVLSKIRDAWNSQVAEKYGMKLDRMKTKEKIKLFNEIKVFT